LPETTPPSVPDPLMVNVPGATVTGDSMRTMREDDSVAFVPITTCPLYVSWAALIDEALTTVERILLVPLRSRVRVDLPGAVLLVDQASTAAGRLAANLTNTSSKLFTRRP
jgi:hypothetical protein